MRDHFVVFVVIFVSCFQRELNVKSEENFENITLDSGVLVS